MSLTEGMSRQQRRNFARAANKKIGQIHSIQNEFKHPQPIRKAKANFKNLLRLQGDLMSMGVIKAPTRWQRLKGRALATLKAVKDRLF